MRRQSHDIDIGASCETVFDVVHDYQRRLEWDSMLSDARLLGGATSAGVGVRTLCVGTWKGAFQALETEYIRFERGRLAAVELTNCPLFFRRFAASIRHQPLDRGRSRLTYIYSFRAQPAILAPLLEPLMRWRLNREVRERLARLRAYIEEGQGSPPAAVVRSQSVVAKGPQAG